MIIAIDGPSASGKGTLARRLARHFDLAYLDTGLLYRAVGLVLLRQGADPTDPAAAEAAARAIGRHDLDDPALRSDEVAQAASKVAAIPGVRAALLDFQRRFAADPPATADGRRPAGAVLDGRDIGTVVCPDADVKFFVIASLASRADRRFKELRDKGVKVIGSRVLRDMKERDARDSAREIAPLAASPDAITLDTTKLDADAVFEAALAHIEPRSKIEPRANEDAG